jgi:hypothetical protein
MAHCFSPQTLQIGPQKSGEVLSRLGIFLRIFVLFERNFCIFWGKKPRGYFCIILGGGGFLFFRAILIEFKLIKGNIIKWVSKLLHLVSKALGI